MKLKIENIITPINEETLNKYIENAKKEDGFYFDSEVENKIEEIDGGIFCIEPIKNDVIMIGITIAFYDNEEIGVIRKIYPFDFYFKVSKTGVYYLESDSEKEINNSERNFAQQKGSEFINILASFFKAEGVSE